MKNDYKGEASRTYSKYRQHSLEWLGNYAMELKGHRARAMVGYSYQYFQNSGLNAANKDFCTTTSVPVNGPRKKDATKWVPTKAILN